MNAFWHPPPDGFELGPCIGGRTGVTRVFAARDQHGEPCALKTLAPDAAARPQNVVRFAREIAAHTASTGIQSVATARAVGLECTWLAIAWAHGGDLATAAERFPPARERIAERAREIVTLLLGALLALHARGIAHRDIKPSNILLDGDSIWLTDFGIAGRREVRDGTAEWVALPAPWREVSVGTPPWSAPELEGAIPVVTPASDIYSMAMLWKWMTGLAAVPVSLRAGEGSLVAAMLHANPAQRPSAAEAAESLKLMTMGRW